MDSRLKSKTVARGIGCGAALLWLGVGFAAAPTAQAGSGGATVVPVAATFSGTTEINNVVCSSEVGSCEVYFSGQEVFSGSWDGNAHYYGHGHYREDGSIEFVATQTFTGAVSGCGSGSFSMSEQGVAHPAESNPLAGGIPVTADWQVIPGSGSAGLGGLRGGSGTFEYVFRPDRSFEDGKAAGTLTCTPPQRRQ